MAADMTHTHPGADARIEPVACRLGAGDQETRLGQWRQLRREGLIREHRDGLALTTDWRRRGDVAARLNALVEAEKQCCGFLNFEVEELGDIVRVRTVFPEGAESLLEAFAQ